MNGNPDEPIDPQVDDVIEPAQAEPAAAQPMDGNGKADTISEAVRRSREAIPVGDRGVTPTAYEHQIVIAKDRAKAHLLLPPHMRGNAPVMAAIVGFCARFDLEPVMFASQTYVVPGSDRLSFMSQAFGAILYASKLLIGRLKYEYHGEGDDLTCTVTGRFKEDPDASYEATTPPLKQVRKHSPLWRDDPEQQLGYFAQRRWMRRYTPDVCMGMYTREEITEIDEFRQSRGETVPLTADRLGQLDTGEGWGEGEHVDLDLAAIAPEEPEMPWTDPEPDAESETPPRKVALKTPGRAQRKPVQARKPTGRPKTSPAQKSRPVRPARARARAPSKAEVKAAVKRAELPPRRVIAAPPKWLDYIQQAEAWIAGAINPEKAEKRWDQERDERDRLMVPMGERSRLRAMLDRKQLQLRPRPMKPEGETE